jgi:hypothetical protein
VDLTQLRSHLNRPVRLSFVDGEVVDVILLGVNLGQERDLTYEVQRIVHHAAPPSKGTRQKGTVIAKLEDLEEWQVLSGSSAIGDAC